MWLMISPTLIADRYQLVEEIGRGATGIIYRGVDNATAVPVAIKMLDEQVMAADADLPVRFQREGELLRQLNHPNIVKMLAAVEQNGRYFLVMEYMPGGDLRQQLRRVGTLPLEQALTIALDLADALTRTHRLNILHRDLKPANVLLDEQGLPRLTDFGVAHVGQAAELTQQGAILGTIAYLSPEACVGETLDERADIWSFGVMLYEMLLGKRPFDAPTIPAILEAILNRPVPLLRPLRPEIPEELEELIERMLVKNREHRIPSVRQVGAELEAILKGRERLTTTPLALRSPFATSTPITAVIRHNLPRETNVFVGRQRELTTLMQLLTDPAIPLLTIVGPGGIGKTRLVQEIGRRLVTPEVEEEGETVVAGKRPFPDGVFFVSLASLSDPANMTTVLADAFHYRFHGESDLQRQILTLLSNKRLLLILDNFEHLLLHDGQETAKGQAFVAEILREAPHVKLCITSRQRLNLRSETTFTVSGLDFPRNLPTAEQTSAVQLFLQSAKQAKYDFELQAEDLPHVAQICNLVQGVPLGIVLAAAWVDMVPLAAIAQEIQRDAGFLESELDDLPTRQRSIRATFAYSWQLLQAEERTVFSRLAVFRGGFTRQAAKTVAQTSLQLLSRLVNRSLLHYDAAQDRYTVHALLGQFAKEKLEEAQQLAAMQLAHSHYYLQLVAASENDLKGRDQKGGLGRITADLENIRAAWHFATRTADLDILNHALEGLHLFFDLNAQAAVGVAELTQTLTQLPHNETNRHLRWRILNRIYRLQPNDGQFNPTDIEELVAYFAGRGDTLEEAIGLDNKAKYLSLQQQFDVALALRQRCVAQLAQLGEHFYRSRCYINIAAHTVNQMGLLDVFIEAGEQSYQLTAAAGDWLGMRQALHMKAGYSLFFVGAYRRAVAQYQEAIEVATKVGGTHLRAQSLPSLSFAQFLLGEFALAQEGNQTALTIFSERNDPLHLALSKRNRGFLALVAGDAAAAQKDFGEALGLTKEVAVVGTAFVGLTTAAWVQGDYQQAMVYLLLLLPGVLAGKSYVVLIWCLPTVAACLMVAKRVERAVEILAMAEVHPACPHGWWSHWSLTQRLSAKLRALLPPAVYAAAQARGRGLDLAETAVSLLTELKQIG